MTTKEIYRVGYPFEFVDDEANMTALSTPLDEQPTIQLDKYLASEHIAHGGYNYNLFKENLVKSFAQNMYRKTRMQSYCFEETPLKDNCHQFLLLILLL